MVVPQRVKNLLSLGQVSLLAPALSAYKLTRFFGMEKPFRNALLPVDYKAQVLELDLV